MFRSALLPRATECFVGRDNVLVTIIPSAPFGAFDNSLRVPFFGCALGMND